MSATTHDVSYTREQLIHAAKVYGSMNHKRIDTENYLKLIFHWEQTVATAVLDEIERQVNGANTAVQAPSASVAVAEEPDNAVKSMLDEDWQLLVTGEVSVNVAAPQRRQPEGFRALAFRSLARGEGRVLPIAVGGKQPLIKWKDTPIDTLPYEEWAKIAPHWIEEQAAKFQNANAAAIMKPDENCAIDEDSDDFRTGFETWSGQSFPRTFTTSARAGHRQSHWLQTDKTRSLGNVGQDSLVVGSMRQHNLYVLAEGSQYKDGVRYYDVADDSPIALMPDKLVEYIKHLIALQDEKAGTKPESTSDSTVDLDSPFIRGTLHPRLVSLAGYYVQNKNISDADELNTLLIARIEKNGCYLSDGRTPFNYDADKVKKIAESAVQSWKTGEQKKQESQLTLNQSQQPQVSDDAKVKAQDEYDALVEQCQKEEEKVGNPYPVDAWEGTPYHDFALLCRGEGRNENHIPKEYFINGMMTTVGAICGNRIVPQFNPTLQARFITLLLSTIGGIGKNVVMDWSKLPFAETGLIYQSDLGRQFTNIGCYVADFGSARGMADTMQRHPRILQEYAEFSTVVEKFSIAGSGDAFRDMILNLADGQVPNWSIIKGTKISPNAPKEISNSILAGTTTERFDEMMMRANWETFIQRINLVPTEETRSKFKLVMPDLSSMQEKLLPRINMLEGHKLVWTLSPEAEALGEEWFESLHEKTGEDDTESVGRIQVFLFRIISHLALWLAPLPTTVGVETTADGRANAIWTYEVPVDVMKRAIRVAEHQVLARSANMPVRGSTTSGIVENLITKWTFKNKSIRWIELKRRSKIARFGHKSCHDALMNLQRSRVVFVKANPEDEADQRDWVVVWVGSDGKYRKWRETREKV
jgi:hypothetical protein